MVVTERIAFALLTIFLNRVFRKFPFLQASVIENPASNYFLNPRFVVVGGIFYYVIRNRCRLWIERFRTRRNMRLAVTAYNFGEINQISQSKTEKAKSWLAFKCRTAGVLQQITQQSMVSNHQLENSCHTKTTGLGSKVLKKRRWRNHPNKIKRKSHTTTKEVHVDPQPCTSKTPDNCSSKQVLREETDLDFNQTTSHNEDVENPVVKQITPTFPTTLGSSNKALGEICGMFPSRVCPGSSGDHPPPEEICIMCFRRKRIRNVSPNSQSECLDKIKLKKKN